MKTNTSLIAAALCGLSMAADDSTITTTIMMVNGGNVGGVDFHGSVIGAGPNETTIALGCEAHSAVSRDFCEALGTGTLITGPSTYSLEAQREDVYIQHIDCAVKGTTQAVCVATEEYLVTSSGISAMPARTQTVPGSSMNMVPVTITAGVAKLDATDAPSATGTESESESAGADESSSTGAAPKITGVAQWAVGGMAAVALAAAA